MERTMGKIKAWLDRVLFGPIRNVRTRLDQASMDPSTKEGSMSRICLGVIVLIFYPVGIYLRTQNIDILSALNTATGIMAGIYGANSAAQVWRRFTGNQRYGPGYGPGMEMPNRGEQEGE